MINGVKWKNKGQNKSSFTFHKEESAYFLSFRISCPLKKSIINFFQSHPRFLDMFERHTTSRLLQFQETGQRLQAECEILTGKKKHSKCSFSSKILRWDWVVSLQVYIKLHSVCQKGHRSRVQLRSSVGGLTLDAMSDWVSLSCCCCFMKLDIRADWSGSGQSSIVAFCGLVVWCGAALYDVSNSRNVIHLNHKAFSWN